MFTFTKQTDLKLHLQSSHSRKSIGFVPTMGALHQGHLALIKQSLDENMVTVVSIFVNPTQFNSADDLKKYPRTFDQDSEKIQNLSNEIILFAPTVDDMYDGKAVSDHFEYDGLELQMEGKQRPGHFDGVGTIVKKLFQIVNPAKAYFGEKDFQQLQIVRKMVENHHLKVEVVGCPIFREKNGLAMSSRNERLSAQNRAEAKIIFETLLKAKTMFGTKSANHVSDYVENVFKFNENFKLEYFEIAFEDSLLPCFENIKNKNCRAFIAVFCGDVRLIDTMRF